MTDIINSLKNSLKKDKKIIENKIKLNEQEKEKLKKRIDAIEQIVSSTKESLKKDIDIFVARCNRELQEEFYKKYSIYGTKEMKGFLEKYEAAIRKAASDLNKEHKNNFKHLKDYIKDIKKN